MVLLMTSDSSIFICLVQLYRFRLTSLNLLAAVALRRHKTDIIAPGNHFARSSTLGSLPGPVGQATARMAAIRHFDLGPAASASEAVDYFHSRVYGYIRRVSSSSDTFIEM